MTFPTIAAGARANEAIGEYDNFIEYLNAVAAVAGTVSALETEIATKAPSSAVDVVSDAVATLAGDVDNTFSIATGAAQKAQNLNDLTDKAAARTNLGTISTSDARLSDARTPTDGSVSTVKIADGAVTDAKLANPKIAASLLDAKGDILIGTANDIPARLPVGANDVSVLRPQASASAGLAYVQDRLTIPVGNYFAVNGGLTSVGMANVGGSACVQAAAIPHPMTISEVRIRIASAASAGQTLRLAAWHVAANGWQPGSLLADWGIVGADSTGVKAVTGLSTALPAGLIYVGYVSMTTAAVAGAVFGQPPGTGQSSSDATLSVVNASGFIGVVGTGAPPTSPFPAHSVTNATCAFEFRRSA